MKINSTNVSFANELRALIQQRTKTIDDGESVAMILLWSFLDDHARCHGMDVSKLAREQLDAFSEWARQNMRVEKAH